MAGQDQVRPARRDGDDEPRRRAGARAGRAGQDTEVDALLEEIDEVLESNAEQFVRGLRAEGRRVAERRSSEPMSTR